MLHIQELFVNCYSTWSHDSKVTQYNTSIHFQKYLTQAASCLNCKVDALKEIIFMLEYQILNHSPKIVWVLAYCPLYYSIHGCAFINNKLKYQIKSR